jgi:acyl-CoA synthetase (AMP-forming)/AMP-acid ligase II
VPRTLSEVLIRTGERFPGRSVSVAHGRRGVFQSRAFAELAALAGSAAARLHALGVRPRDRLLIALPTSWSWLEAWFGATLLGAWPVAVAPGRVLGALGDQVRRVGELVDAMGVRTVIAGEALLATARSEGISPLANRLVTAERFAATTPDPAWRPALPDPDDVAHLQLTSGSTGRPRAVMVTHRNVVENVTAIDEILGRLHGAPAHAWADAWVSWLPLHHDMGLVGCLWQPLVCGIDARLLETSSFLARPRRWLEALSGPGVTMTAAPNQGYQMAAERLPPGRSEDIDLRACRVAVNGAETVRAETARAFGQAFGDRGFASEALRPCYGLAEATLAVTVDSRGQGVRTRPAPAEGVGGFGMAEVACVGEPLRGTALRVVAADGTVLGDGCVGEIHVRGPGVFRGYLDDDAATEAAMDGDWLRTGDLGFLHDGELYVSGRLKDVLIVSGENLMPEEIEALADALSGGGGTCRSAAFSVTGAEPGERVILVVETDVQDEERLRTQERDIRRAVGRALGLPLADVAFVRRGAIPRTTSGKLQRARLRGLYRTGGLKRLQSGGTP